MLNWLNNLVKSRDIMAATVIADTFSSEVRQPFKFLDYVREGYKQNNVVYACIQGIANACKNIEIELLRNGEVIDPDNYSREERFLMDLIAMPNTGMGREDYIEQLVIHLSCGGIAHPWLMFADQVMTEANRRRFEMHLIRPDKIRVHGNDFGVDHYTYSVKERALTTDEMTHIRYIDPESTLAGFAPMQAAAAVIDSYNQSVEWNWKTLKSGGVIQTVITLKGAMNVRVDEFKRLIQEWNTRSQESKTKRHPLILPGESMDVTNLTSNAQEIDWLNGQRDLMRAIARCFKYPSELLGDPESTTYNNVSEANRALYRNTAIPIVKLELGAYNRWLCPKFGEGITLRENIDAIDVLQEGANDRITRLMNSSWKTINEKRLEDDGLQPIDGGDVLLVSQGFLPLSMINEPFIDLMEPSNVDDTANTNA